VTASLLLRRRIMVLSMAAELTNIALILAWSLGSVAIVSVLMQVFVFGPMQEKGNPRWSRERMKRRERRLGSRGYDYVAASAADVALLLGLTRANDLEGHGDVTWSGTWRGHAVELRVERRGERGAVAAAVGCDVGERKSTNSIHDPLVLDTLVIERRADPLLGMDRPPLGAVTTGDPGFDQWMSVRGDRVAVAAGLDARLRKVLVERFQMGMRFEGGALATHVPAEGRIAMLETLDALIDVADAINGRVERSVRQGGRADALAWNALRDPERTVRQRCMAQLMENFRHEEVAIDTLSAALIHRNHDVRLDALPYADRDRFVRVATGLLSDAAAETVVRLEAARALATFEPTHPAFRAWSAWLIECLDLSEDAAVLSATILGATAGLDAVHAMRHGPNARGRSREVHTAIEAAVGQIRERHGGGEDGGLALVTEESLGELALPPDAEELRASTVKRGP